MTHRILVVDDDSHIRDIICFTLKKAGMDSRIARDGEEALQAFADEAPDLIILDVGMPEMDGLEVCRQIRKTSDIPILFLSARDEEIDRILGLEMGGDDYVTKPFSPRELVARVNVILRRLRTRDGVPVAPKTLSRGALVLNSEAHVVTFDGVAVALTSIEFGIIRTLLARPGIVFNREQILNMAYSDNMHVSDRTIDSHVRNIRMKMTAAGCDSVIETVHGVGFRLGLCEVKA